MTILTKYSPRSYLQEKIWLTKVNVYGSKFSQDTLTFVNPTFCYK